MNPVPPMTHPYGKYWEQPDPNGMLFDDTHVVMTAKDFNSLPQYNATCPTGTYPGKMWACVYSFDDQKFLVWYGEVSADGKNIAIERRRVLIV